MDDRLTEQEDRLCEWFLHVTSLPACSNTASHTSARVTGNALHKPMDNEERQYCVSFNRAPNIGPGRVPLLLSRFGSLEETRKASGDFLTGAIVGEQLPMAAFFTAADDNEATFLGTLTYKRRCRPLLRVAYGDSKRYSCNDGA